MLPQPLGALGAGLTFQRGDARLNIDPSKGTATAYDGQGHAVGVDARNGQIAYADKNGNSVVVGRDGAVANIDGTTVVVGNDPTVAARVVNATHELLSDRASDIAAVAALINLLQAGLGTKQLAAAVQNPAVQSAIVAGRSWKPMVGASFQHWYRGWLPLWLNHQRDFDANFGALGRLRSYVRLDELRNAVQTSVAAVFRAYGTGQQGPALRSTFIAGVNAWLLGQVKASISWWCGYGTKAEQAAWPGGGADLDGRWNGLVDQIAAWFVATPAATRDTAIEVMRQALTNNGRVTFPADGQTLPGQTPATGPIAPLTPAPSAGQQAAGWSTGAKIAVVGGVLLVIVGGVVVARRATHHRGARRAAA